MVIIKLLLNTQNDMRDVYKNIEEVSPRKKRKVLIAFDYLIIHLISQKKLTSIVTVY